MKLPSDTFPPRETERRGSLPSGGLYAPRPTRNPADLTSAGESLFPALPQSGAPAPLPDGPIPSFDTARLTDAFIKPIDFAASGPILALERTNQKRMGLLIVNVNIAGGVYYNFDQDANNVNGVPIPNSGNRLYDVNVPQGVLYLFAAGAGRVVIEYQYPAK